MELPPNVPVRRFGRLVVDAIGVTGDLQPERVLAMVLRDRTNAERTQEVLFVEGAREDAFEPLVIHDGEQHAAVEALVVERRDVGTERRRVLQEPQHPSAKLRDAQAHTRVADGDREERQQSDQRSNLQRNGAAVVEFEHVVVEAVFVVPQTIFAGEAIQGVRDVEEVLEELRGDVFVDVILLRDFERHREHVERVDGHPARCRRIG